MNLLLDAYKTALLTMDETILRPFSEFEVQPLFAREWISRTIPLYQQFDFSVNLEFYFLNKSVTRSMYITDLLDNYYAFKDEPNTFTENLNTLKTFWGRVCAEFYGSYFFGADPFSQFCNRPVGELLDREFTYYHNTALFETLALCHAIAYAKNLDIMADNTYEITGPFTQHEYCVQKNKFHQVLGGDDLTFYTWKYRERNNSTDNNSAFKPVPKPQIDIFGHSTLGGLNNISGYYTDTPIYPSTVPQLNLQLLQELNYWIHKSKTNTLLYYLQRRLDRYRKLGVILDVDRLVQQAGKLFPRLTKSQMINVLEVATTVKN